MKLDCVEEGRLELQNIVGVETRGGLRTIELYVGDLTSESLEVDVLVLSAFSGGYQPIPETLPGSLYLRMGIDLGALSENPDLDFRSTLSTWVSAPLAETRLGRLLCVELVGSTLPIDEVICNAFATVAVLEAKGEPIRTIAMPLLGTGNQKLSVTEVLPPLIDASRQALSRSSSLERILFVEKSREKVERLVEELDRHLERTQVALPTSPSVRAIRNELLAAVRNAEARVDPGDRHLFSEFATALSADRPMSVNLAVLGRRLAEFVIGDMLGYRGERVDLVVMIRELNDFRVASWITSYLHTLRHLGNESAHHRRRNRCVPDCLEETDVMVGLVCCLRVLQFWADRRLQRPAGSRASG